MAGIVDLMKKGLRLGPVIAAKLRGGRNRRPDEEGIKTTLEGLSSEKTSRNRRPDEEGIKTSNPDAVSRAVEGRNRRPDEEGIKTKPLCSIPAIEIPCRNRRPDEEGIKTERLTECISQSAQPESST